MPHVAFPLTESTAVWIKEPQYDLSHTECYIANALLPNEISLFETLTI